jgi:hypothetical protein
MFSLRRCSERMTRNARSRGKTPGRQRFRLVAGSLLHAYPKITSALVSGVSARVADPPGVGGPPRRLVTTRCRRTDTMRPWPHEAGKSAFRCPVAEVVARPARTTQARVCLGKREIPGLRSVPSWRSWESFWWHGLTRGCLRVRLVAREARFLESRKANPLKQLGLWWRRRHLVARFSVWWHGGCPPFDTYKTQ